MLREVRDMPREAGEALRAVLAGFAQGRCGCHSASGLTPAHRAVNGSPGPQASGCIQYPEGEPEATLLPHTTFTRRRMQF